jgi:hypothetical protein
MIDRTQTEEARVIIAGQTKPNAGSDRARVIIAGLKLKSNKVFHAICTIPQKEEIGHIQNPNNKV